MNCFWLHFNLIYKSIEFCWPNDLQNPNLWCIFDSHAHNEQNENLQHCTTEERTKNEQKKCNCCFKMRQFPFSFREMYHSNWLHKSNSFLSLPFRFWALILRLTSDLIVNTIELYTMTGQIQYMYIVYVVYFIDFTWIRLRSRHFLPWLNFNRAHYVYCFRAPENFTSLSRS